MQDLPADSQVWLDIRTNLLRALFSIVNLCSAVTSISCPSAYLSAAYVLNRNCEVSAQHHAWVNVFHQAALRIRRNAVEALPAFHRTQDAHMEESKPAVRHTAVQVLDCGPGKASCLCNTCKGQVRICHCQSTGAYWKCFIRRPLLFAVHL